MNQRFMLGTKRCSQCNGSINAFTEEDQEHFYEVRYRTPQPGQTVTKIYYHAECAPFGATRIPEEVGAR